ncbi:MAG: YitT family protein [Anaeroplasmataceae bacterium]
MKKHIIQSLWIVFGVLLMVIAYYFFYKPTNLVNGGTTGISIIVKDYIPIPTWAFLYIVDGILLLIGLFILGREFFYKTVIATITFPAIEGIFEKLFDSNFFFRSGEVQSKYFVACVVGALFLGVGLGICFRNNGTTGGMDVVQKALTKYFHIPYSVSIYCTDTIIILIGGFFSSSGAYDIEMVVYGIINVIAVGYIVDFIASNAKSRRTAYIITTKPLEIRDMIYNKIDRGVTFCDVRGGYTEEEKTMVICTLDKNESYRLSEWVKEVDQKAFTFITQTKEVAGNYEGIESLRRHR